MATNKQLFTIQKYLSSSAVGKFKLERVFEVNKAKTPKLYDDIVNDVQFLENNGLFILIDGEDVQVKYANGIKVWSDAISLVGGEDEPITVSWDDVTDKPITYPPTIGTTSTTAKAGDYQPTWAEVTGKPTTFTPSAHQHSASDINTGTLNTARIPNLDASKITTGTFNVGRVNAVLDGYTIGTAGAVADTDTLLEAIGKLEARIVALETAGE